MKPIVATALASSLLVGFYLFNGNRPYLQTTSNLRCPVLKDVQTIKNSLSNPL